MAVEAVGGGVMGRSCLCGVYESEPNGILANHRRYRECGSSGAAAGGALGVAASGLAGLAASGLAGADGALRLRPISSPSRYTAATGTAQAAAASPTTSAWAIVRSRR